MSKNWGWFTCSWVDLPNTLGKIFGHTGFFSFSIATSLGEGWIQTCHTLLKNDFKPHPACRPSAISRAD